MEDKTFELLSKIYGEMQEGFKSIRGEVNELKGEVKEIKGELQGVRQDIVRLENKIDDNHKALYDGYKQNSEGIYILKEEMKKLTDKVEHQEIKLQVIKGAK